LTVQSLRPCVVDPKPQGGRGRCAAPPADRQLPQAALDPQEANPATGVQVRCEIARGNQYEAQVAEFFPQYDVLLLDEDRVVAGGWGVAIRWDGTVEDLPDGYDATMVRAVEGHQGGIAATTLSYMTVAVVNGMTKPGFAGKVLTAL
jgi:hypothetical protein